MTKEHRSSRTIWLAVAGAALVIVIGVGAVVLRSVVSGPNWGPPATGTFDQIKFGERPTVVSKSEDRYGADYVLRFGKPFSVKDVTMPTGFTVVSDHEYGYGPDTALGSFDGTAPGDAATRCDALFVPPHDSADRQLIRVEVRCGEA